MSEPVSAAPFATYEEAMDFLFKMVDYEKISSHKYSLADFDLSRTEALLASVGAPHRRSRAVHVAGTKGKGSTSTILRALLTRCGRRTGLFTSPHLVHLEERITIDGARISCDDVRRLLGTLRPYTEQVRRESPRDSPTFFELVTALAFQYFAEQRTDFDVVEVGMGGRLDSTNVLSPLVCIITRVDFDHVRRLGPTLANIAREKAGIIKPKVPVVCATQAPEALAVIEQTAADRRAPLLRLGRDFSIADVVSFLDEAVGGSCRFTLRTPRAAYEALSLPLLGVHQAENAALAVRAAEVLAERVGDLPLDETAVREGLAAVRMPARIEVVPGKPLILLDGAHNVAAMRALRAVIERHLAGRRILVVFGVAADKQVEEILREMLPFAAEVFLTKSDSPRAVAPQTLLEKVRAMGDVPARAIEEAHSALAEARSRARADDVVCVTGSLYLAGMLRPVLLPQEYPAPALARP